MPEPLRWLLAALATYRLAELVAIDDGPGDIFLQLRSWAGGYEYGPDGRPARALGRLLRCPYCLGIWAGALCAASALWPSGPGDVFLAVLGLAGAQAALSGAREAEG